MIRYMFFKTLNLILTLFLISLLTFYIFQILPGDPALIILGPDADQNQLDILRSNLYMDLPIYERYLNWLTAAIKLDFGTSLRFNVSVNELIINMLPPTLLLTCISFLLSIFIGIPLGIYIGKNNNNFLGFSLSNFSQLGLSIPSFFIAILLSYIFGIVFNIFPTTGYIPITYSPFLAVHSLFLPALSIAIGNIAIIVRFLKNQVVEELKKDYVRTAKSKGLSDNYILYKHVLKNALIPTTTILSLILINTLVGSIIIENVFSIPGIGTLLITSINSRDLILTQAVIIYITFIVVLINFFTDLIYRLIDPRIS